MSEQWDPSTYGDRIAGIYDARHLPGRDPQPAVDTLIDLARLSRVLELGIGTGRVALPLAEHGLEVHGIDASAAMLAELAKKPAAEQITTTEGDFADVAVDGTFGLIFVVFNTFFSLLTQTDQVRCLTNVAQRLEPGGRFVIESFVPDLTRFTRAQNIEVDDVGLDAAAFSMTKHSRSVQQITSMHVVLTTEGTQLYPVRGRYAYPSELDLMAQLAGLELEARWGTWDRRTFDDTSTDHISVYRRP